MVGWYASMMYLTNSLRQENITQASYADKTEIRTFSVDELSLAAGGFNWDKVQWGKAVVVGVVTGLSAGVADLIGGPGVAAVAAVGGFVGGFGSTVVSGGQE